MKKLLLTTGVIFLLIFNVQAQESDSFIKNKTTFGIKGGLNFSHLSNVSKSESYSGIELYGSLFSETRFSKKSRFQNELVFSYTDGYHYLEFPFLLKYHFNDKWAVFAGPKLDFILDNDFEYVDQNFKTLGISAVIGVEYKVSKKFFAEATYNFGFTKQIQTQNLYSTTRKTFRISLGYRF